MTQIDKGPYAARIHPAEGHDGASCSCDAKHSPLGIADTVEGKGDARPSALAGQRARAYAARAPGMRNYITVTVPKGRFQAYVARPIALPAPVVVVIQEIFGVNADLRSACDGLAARGYLAVSPDLFWRMERGVDLSDRTEAERMKGFALHTAFDIDSGVADIAATMETARSLPGFNGKLGVMGYSLGGLMTFIMAARKGADASVVYYGGRTETYLHEASRINSPLLIHLGEEDEYISKRAQRAITKALADNASAHVFTYPGCRHAFARRHGVHYVEDAAMLANGRTADFFDLHLRSAHWLESGPREA